MRRDFVLICLRLTIYFTALNKAWGQRSRNNCEMSLWPGARVEYELHPELSKYEDFVTRFYNLTMLIGSRTCIRFYRTRKLRNDIVFIMPLDTAFANRGRQRNSRNGLFKYTLVSLPKTSDERTMLHELMHSIGIAGEQNREDRDTYIQINYPHISSSKKAAFDKIMFPPKPSAYPPYSLKTAMHYPLEAFATGPNIRTITIKNNTITPAEDQSKHHVDYDLDRISGLYYHLYKCQQLQECKHLTCIQSNYIIRSQYCH